MLQKLESTELETLCVTIAINKLESYLKGRKINLITDYKAIFIYITQKDE